MRQAFARILLAVSAVMFADAAMACSCARNPTAESILDGAATVFTGVARMSAAAGPGRSITAFTVVESFKGASNGATVRVLHPSGSSASCGVKFSAGQTYTLAAHRIDADSDLTTSLCSTWMFLPHVGLSTDLLQRMRAIRIRRGKAP